MERVNGGQSLIIERNTTLSNIIFMGIDDWFDVVVSQHEQLVQAIEDKNARKTIAIMIQHLEDSIRKIEKLSRDGKFPFAYKWILPNSSVMGCFTNVDLGRTGKFSEKIGHRRNIKIKPAQRRLLLEIANSSQLSVPLRVNERRFTEQRR